MREPEHWIVTALDTLYAKGKRQRAARQQIQAEEDDMKGNVWKELCVVGVLILGIIVWMIVLNLLAKAFGYID
jgi:hypothetical protein